jgi:hypothetical protein
VCVCVCTFIHLSVCAWRPLQFPECPVCVASRKIPRMVQRPVHLPEQRHAINGMYESHTNTYEYLSVVCCDECFNAFFADKRQTFRFKIPLVKASEEQ